MLVVDAHLDLAMNAVMWNRDLALSRARDAAHRARRGIDREGAGGRDGRVPGSAGGRDRARLRHGHRAQEPRPEQRHRLPHPRDRLRPGAGAARLLPGVGAAGDHPAHPHPSRPGHLARGLGGGPSERAVRVRPAHGRGRPDRRAGAGPALVGRWAAHGRSRPLRSERLRLRHRQRRPADREGARALTRSWTSWG